MPAGLPIAFCHWTAGRAVVPKSSIATSRTARSPMEHAPQSVKTGCVVVRGVFPASVASDWFSERCD
jgi:hypothetical protein